MLQQTQFAVVISAFSKWLTKLPTLTALASATEQDVLQLWAGLGYYRRAKSLHRAAKQMLAQGHTNLPNTRQELQSLPGIGPYTAGAILSLAYNQAEPIVDGNIIRVFSRVYRIPTLPSSSIDTDVYWKKAREWVAGKNPGLVAEALMELGATVCTKANPKCAECPLANDCQSYCAGCTDQYPQKAVQVKGVHLHGIACVMSEKKGVWLQRCKGGLLDHHWTIPFAFASHESLGSLPFGELNSLCIDGKKMGSIKHSITKYRMNIDVYTLETNSHRIQTNAQKIKWKRVALSEVQQHLVHNLGRKILAARNINRVDRST